MNLLAQQTPETLLIDIGPATVQIGVSVGLAALAIFVGLKTFEVVKRFFTEGYIRYQADGDWDDVERVNWKGQVISHGYINHAGDVLHETQVPSKGINHLGGASEMTWEGASTPEDAYDPYDQMMMDNYGMFDEPKTFGGFAPKSDPGNGIDEYGGASTRDGDGRYAEQYGPDKVGFVDPDYAPTYEPTERISAEMRDGGIVQGERWRVEEMQYADSIGVPYGEVGSGLQDYDNKEDWYRDGKSPSQKRI